MILATQAFGLFFLFFVGEGSGFLLSGNCGLEVLGINLPCCDFLYRGCVDGNILIFLWISNPLQTRRLSWMSFQCGWKVGVFIFLERKGERPASCRGGRAKWREAKRRSISKRKRKGEGGTGETFLVKKCHDLSNQKKKTIVWRCIWVSPIFHIWWFSPLPSTRKLEGTLCFFFRKPCPSIHRCASTSTLWYHDVLHVCPTTIN